VSDATTTVDVHLGPAELVDALRTEAREGLTAEPKVLSPKWFYDERGSELFEAITRLPEYYPFRRELAILSSHAADVAAAARPTTLIELGSGTSEKTRLLLDACLAEGTLERFVPFDVSEPTLRQAADAIAEEHPSLAVHALVGDFERHLELLPTGGRRLIAFLGGTIGNMLPEQRHRFVREIAAGMSPGDTFLLGTDLQKDHDRLVRAYDDAAGVTAEFNRNVLHVLNRELRADFPVGSFDHVARYDVAHEHIEMRLRARHAMDVHLEALDLVVHFEAGEELRTETSAKFTPAGLAVELAAAGLRLDEQWFDAERDFLLSLSTIER
jgi:L-histidine Nalpha-methyltransferase